MVYTKNRVKLLLFYDIQKGFGKKIFWHNICYNHVGIWNKFVSLQSNRFIITNNKITVNG